MLASDDQNPQFTGARNPDDILHVVFFMRSEQNNFETEKQGRPIFYEIPYVRIQIPGNQLSIIETPAIADHKKRFPRQWAHFQNINTVAESVIGTPVEQWPALTRSQAEELRAVKFFAVEQIANCSDQQLQTLGMNGPMLRQKAIAFLASAKDTALAQSQAAELQRKDQEITDLKAMVQRLADKIEEKPKRKYAKRVKEVAPA